ncbi:MAG TPA: response regulator [Verrucomicrobiae bacterium]|nr:response regulator [Verrucomicrobiae bacterium]
MITSQSIVSVSNQPPILVVEDNEDHVFLLNHAFQKAGILNPVQVANNGEDAIAYLEGTGRYSDWKEFPLPLMVLLDIKMPGLGGFDVLRWIRQQPGLKALRVAMLTSSDLDQEIKLAYELGANVFLTKPVDLNRLVEMVKVVRAHWLELAQMPEVCRGGNRSS